MRKLLAAALVMSLSLPARADDSGPGVVTWVGFGVAGAGVVVGTLFGADAMQAASAAREQCVGTRCPPSAQTLIDQSKSSALISTISFGVAIVGLGVGIYGLQAHEDKKLEQKQVSLRLGPGGVGLVGAF